MYLSTSVCAALLALFGGFGPLLAWQAPPPDTMGGLENVAEGASWTIDQAASVFAVVTQKAGFAARLAHNHLVVAGPSTIHLELDADRLERTAFGMVTSAHDLVVDDPEQRARWQDRIRDLDLVDELGAPGDSDREKIRDTMLSDEQLDAESDPEISVTLLGIAPGETQSGSVTFPYFADIAVRVRGQTVEREVAADFRIEGDRLFVEAVGLFTFTEFGIKPYSAFMGSVKNKDEFTFYLNLQAMR